MWLFTTAGFFSAVALDTRVLKVRTRAKRHLENLKTLDLIPKDIEIIEGGGTDYPYRVLLTTTQWMKVVEHFAGEIDYGNFKGAVGKTGDLDYIEALHRTWSVMQMVESKEKSKEKIANKLARRQAK
jgi:hypothetical protein